MTTTQEQLAALEQHAEVIDPKDDLILCQTGQWYDSPSGNFIYIPSALSIRTQQAIRWLAEWCGKDRVVLHISCSYIGDIPWFITIGSRVFHAASLPEALAACIGEIRKDSTQGKMT